MTRSPEPRDPDFDWEHDADTHQVMFFVRRTTYELSFSIPTTGGADLGGAQGQFQARFRGRQPGQAVVLNREALEDFYESLSHLMEYVRTEQQRLRQSELRSATDDLPRGE